MTAKPVIVVLKPLLQSCLTPGTKAHESGLTVSIEPEKDEEIYFFHIDCQEGNRCLGMNTLEKEKCNDYLVFYTREKSVNEVFCFLELKGKDIQRAKQQVLNTHKYVKALLIDRMSQAQIQNLIWSVYICLSNAAPQETQRVQNELSKLFGKGRVGIRAVREKDITNFPLFLRKLG
ncbi:MAG: hypothetical protein M3Y39_09900 [Chloroflexota bacterium]|nr:hypothetical protein [Chloroflexota bacterium]